MWSGGVTTSIYFSKNPKWPPKTQNGRHKIRCLRFSQKVLRAEAGIVINFNNFYRRLNNAMRHNMYTAKIQNGSRKNQCFETLLLSL